MRSRPYTTILVLLFSAFSQSYEKLHVQNRTEAINRAFGNK